MLLKNIFIFSYFILCMSLFILSILFFYEFVIRDILSSTDYKIEDYKYKKDKKTEKRS